MSINNSASDKHKTLVFGPETATEASNRSARRHNSTYLTYEPSRQVIILLAQMKPHYRRSTRGIVMHHLGKSKVTKLNAKAGVVYPLIRLPKGYADQIGKVAEIFETQHYDRRALLVTFDDEAGPCEVIQPDSKVIQLLPKVIQPDGLNNIESRLSALESQIAELQSLLLENENQKAPQSPLFRQSSPKNQWARPDSNRRPPPCQGDVINALTTKC
jgi:hypothetical protein